MTTNKVAFPVRNPEAFTQDIRSEVAAYFKERGISTKANTAMILKTIVMLGGTYGAYAAIISGRFGPWAMLALAIVMGVGMAGIGFSVSHDALHGSYSSNRRVNRILGFTFDLSGANGYIWRVTHNVVHHTYTNIEGLDEDLEVSPLLRISPEQEYRPVHRFQPYYALFAYGSATLFWVFIKDFKYFLKRDLGPYEDHRPPFSEVVILLITKAIYYTYTIAVPLLVLDITIWQYLIGFVAMHLTAGSILGVIFQLAHVVPETEHPAADEQGNMADSWLVHEMKTTADFAGSNKLLSWYIGGLNYQIEHHLFPKVCSIHYPAISSIVRGIAERHDIPYHDHPTLREAIRAHWSVLRMYSRPNAELQPA